MLIISQINILTILPPFNIIESLVIGYLVWSIAAQFLWWGQWHQNTSTPLLPEGTHVLHMSPIGFDLGPHSLQGTAAGDWALTGASAVTISFQFTFKILCNMIPILHAISVLSPKQNLLLLLGAYLPQLLPCKAIATAGGFPRIPIRKIGKPA